jgi:hypothetical protein
MPPAQPPTPALDRRAVRRTVKTFSVLAAVAAGVAVGVVAFAREDSAATPDGTVRDFLVSSVVDDDGVGACRYLTPRAMREISSVEPRDTPCEAALEFSTLTLGADRLDDEAEVKRLSYHQEQRGDRARVTVGAGGADRTFTLRRATPQEREGIEPPTPWRIDSGVAALVELTGSVRR